MVGRIPQSPLIYINGHLLPSAYARISPLDYGFMYGFSIFETLRSYDGRFFRLREHLARLRKGADALGISGVPDDTQIEKAIRQVLQGNKLKEARVRLTLSAGEGSLSPDLSSCKQPALVVAAAPFVQPGEDIYERGYRAIVSEYRRDSLSPLSGIKSGNYLVSLLSSAGAKRKGAQVAVLLNERGSLSECSMANIFLVKNNRLITPDEKSGILAGITRQEVLQIGRRLGLDEEEREVAPVELLQAEEAFITSSLLEIMPLTAFKIVIPAEAGIHTLPNWKVIGKGLCGDITRRLRAAYKEAVSSDAL